MLPNRRFHCYSIGTGKTGTHSIAGIFARNYRAAHEPESEVLIQKIFEFQEGRISPSDLRSFLVRRDQRLFLELESDGTLYSFLDYLLDEFPNARFLLTIRDCYTWLESVINHNLARRPRGLWRKYDDLTFAQWNFQHTQEERPLADLGLRTLGHYLNHWTTHNQNIIDKVPNERLIVVRTDQIGKSAVEIAAFLGIPAQSLDLSKSHLFKNPQKFNVLSKMSRSFLEDNVRRYCKPLMDRYFPEITHYDQVCSFTSVHTAAPNSIE